MLPHLGAEAYAVASHVTMILVLALLGARVMRGFARTEVLLEAERRGLSAAVALACAALAFERCWFGFARWMRGNGVDVYGLHPVPELMAAIVTGSLYGIGAVVLVAQMGPARAKVRIVREVLALLLVWAAIAVGLD